MEKELTVIEIPASGKKEWYGGAYTLAFLYSKKGNFLVKGYYNEVKAHIKKNYTHYFVNYSLWYRGQNRDIWSFWKDSIGIFEPERRKSKYVSYKWVVREYSDYTKTPEECKKLEFRRLPKRWIKEFEQF